MQFDRCCLVIRMQEMKPLAPDFDCYIDRIDCPAAPQHPHRGRDCRRRARISEVVIRERKKLRRGEGDESVEAIALKDLRPSGDGSKDSGAYS